MIIIKNLKKSFGSKTIFNNFNLNIQTGEFVCISGESGSGKTTLLNIIGLLEPFQEGELYIDNCAYTKNRDKIQFYRNKVGFLFQNFALMENETVIQNLEIIRKDSRTEYSIEEVLSIVGLLEKKNSKIYTLSGGEQQRVALARLFLKKSEIILADEPTGSLDRNNAEKIMELLFDLNRLGKTIVLVTHDEWIKKKIDRVIEL